MVRFAVFLAERDLGLVAIPERLDIRLRAIDDRLEEPLDPCRPFVGLAAGEIEGVNRLVVWGGLLLQLIALFQDLHVLTIVTPSPSCRSNAVVTVKPAWLAHPYSQYSEWELIVMIKFSIGVSLLPALSHM